MARRPPLIGGGHRLLRHRKREQKMLTTSGRNQLLDNTDVAYMSLHNGYPSTTQANEITGGSPAYARKAVTWASASSGSKASSNSQVFDVPAAAAVNWIGYSTALTSGSGRAVAPNGAAPKEFEIDATGDFVLVPGHTYVNTNQITFYGGTAPGGLTAGTTYFVVGSTTDKFQVAATSGGSAIDLTSQGGSDCVVSIILTETFAAQGTFTLGTGNATLALNF
jgi:hypothetical protein